MKLYYTPGACSLAVHIALREAGLEFGLEKVDLASKKTETGADFLAINAKGYVPALQMDNGQVLTEDQVILQYVADLNPTTCLAPPAGSLARYRLMEWLAFIATEVHKGFSPLWNPAAPEAARQQAITQLGRRFDFLSPTLGTQPWLLGDSYSVADAYLFTVLGWADYHKLDLAPWPALVEFRSRVAARPAVQQALKAEGLIA
jgi:glutathione S-transferase